MAQALEEVARQLGEVASPNDVGAFVRKVMGERLAARRELVSTALAESTLRESQRLEAAIPVDLDADPPTAESRPTSGSWELAASRSGSQVIPPPPSPWSVRALAIVAAVSLVVAITSVVAVSNRRPAASAAPPAPTTNLAQATSGPLSNDSHPIPMAITNASTTAPPSANTAANLAPPSASLAGAKGATTRATPKTAKPTPRSRDDEAGF
jgi:hypothetical protein